jgi:hypothetical protein
MLYYQGLNAITAMTGPGQGSYGISDFPHQAPSKAIQAIIRGRKFIGSRKVSPATAADHDGDEGEEAHGEGGDGNGGDEEDRSTDGLGVMEVAESARGNDTAAGIAAGTAAAITPAPAGNRLDSPGIRPAHERTRYLSDTAP